MRDRPFCLIAAHVECFFEACCLFDDGSYGEPVLDGGSVAVGARRVHVYGLSAERAVDWSVLVGCDVVGGLACVSAVGSWVSHGSPGWWVSWRMYSQMPSRWSGWQRVSAASAAAMCCWRFIVSARCGVPGRSSHRLWGGWWLLRLQQEGQCLGMTKPPPFGQGLALLLSVTDGLVACPVIGSACR